MRTRIAAVIVCSSMAWGSQAGAQRAWPSHPVAGNAGKGAVHEVVRVNGVALSSARLDAALNEMIPFESFHRTVSAAKLDELRRKALDRIIDEELGYQEGVRSGIEIPAARLEQEVAAVERRYGSRAALQAALAQAGATMNDLRQELRRTLTAREAERRAITDRCQATPADAAAFYAANPERFVVPEQLHVVAITIGVEPSAAASVWHEARARAEEVQRRILDGSSFADMARQYSTDATRESGGDMGFLHRGSMTDAFERATRALPLRQPSEVVQSLYGYHIVEVTEIRPPRRQTLAEVSSTLQKDLTETRCASMKQSWIASLRQRSTIVPARPEA